VVLARAPGRAQASAEMTSAENPEFRQNRDIGKYLRCALLVASGHFQF
jgi:hypothetical protein